MRTESVKHRSKTPFTYFLLGNSQGGSKVRKIIFRFSVLFGILNDVYNWFGVTVYFVYNHLQGHCLEPGIFILFVM